MKIKSEKRKVMVHTSHLAWNARQCKTRIPKATHGEGKNFSIKLLAVAILVVSALGAHALPMGGAISAGSSGITQSGVTVAVNQALQNLAVNWSNSNIGAHERINFVQLNTSVIALNRVLGGDSSNILRQVNVNGQIWTLNPNGLLFGFSAQMNAGGLVASTLNNIGGANCLAGWCTFSGSGGVVANLDTLNVNYVVLSSGRLLMKTLSSPDWARLP